MGLLPALALQPAQPGMTQKPSPCSKRSGA